MKIINSIHRLPLHTFIDILVGEPDPDNEDHILHNYSLLIVEGEPPVELLINTWKDLLFQYNDAFTDDGQKQYVAALVEYQHAKSNYDRVNSYIEMLNLYFLPKWAKELNRLVDAQFKFNPENREEYLGMLKRCASRNKANLIRFQLAEEQLSKFAKMRVSEEFKPDRGYFTRVMINLKNKNNREIPDTISTFEFCELVNQYTAWVKMMEAENNKLKKRGY